MKAVLAAEGGGKSINAQSTKLSNDGIVRGEENKVDEGWNGRKDDGSERKRCTLLFGGQLRKLSEHMKVLKGAMSKLSCDLHIHCRSCGAVACEKYDGTCSVSGAVNAGRKQLASSMAGLNPMAATPEGATLTMKSGAKASPLKVLLPEEQHTPSPLGSEHEAPGLQSETELEHGTDDDGNIPGLRGLSEHMKVLKEAMTKLSCDLQIYKEKREWSRWGLLHGY